MKKNLLLFLLIIIILLFTLSACSKEGINIEEHEWKMRYAMTAEDGGVVYVAEKEGNAYPRAEIIDVTLVAKNGKIIITDATNDKTYHGTYFVENKTSSGINYKVMIDGKEGYATVSVTTHADGTEEPTLPIRINEYSLYFYIE